MGEKLKKWFKMGCLSTVFLALGCWLAILIGFRGPALPPQPLPESGIIDLHVHCAGIGAGDSGCFISDNLRDSYKFSIYLRAFGVTQEELARSGDALIFEKIAAAVRESRRLDAAVVLALDGVIDENGRLDLKASEVYVPNEFVARQTAKYDHLLFGASINPRRTDALALLEKVHRQGAVLIKWLPSIQGFDPADPQWIPFYQKMAELGLPLLTHTGDEASFTRADNSFADPQKLALPLSLGVRVIAAHVATPGQNQGEANPRRLLRLMDQYPHLYADISSLTQINKIGYLNEFLKKPMLRERLVYGSDFPLIATPLVSPAYFPFNLTRSEMLRIRSIKNSWDRDLELKQALGVPSDVFLRSAQLLKRDKTDPEP